MSDFTYLFQDGIRNALGDKRISDRIYVYLNDFIISVEVVVGNFDIIKVFPCGI